MNGAADCASANGPLSLAAMTPAAPLRLRIDLSALARNWRWFQRQAGVEAGAAVKANGYGLGAVAVAQRLHAEGCRTFYVATWAEAAELAVAAQGARIKVLHGLNADEIESALGIDADPVLSSPEQIALWREAGGGRSCDIMIDTGMNRLGLDWRSFDAAMLDDLNIGIVHSHLACADEPQHPLNAVQLDRFKNVLSALPGVSASIASSGGICLGRDYALNHVRPGLGLYGGTPGPAAAGHIAQVVQPEARIIQVRDVPKGDSAGYGATWIASRSSRIAVINVGYADGYLRGFSNAGTILVDGKQAPVVGRISMDLVIADVTDAPAVGPGDWVGIAYDLLSAASVSDLSQYELLTGLGARYSRIYQ